MLNKEAKMRVMSVTVGIVSVALLFVSGASAGSGDASKGKDTYVQYCASCHGNTGKGDGPAAAAMKPKPRDLTNKDYMATLEEKYLVDVITKGGAAVGKSALMPPWGAVLKAGDIDNVIAYIRALGSQ